MLKAKFGIEIEFTGITRTKAAEIMAKHFNSTLTSVGDYYDKKIVIDSHGRKWTVMYDGSICPLKKENGSKIHASDLYKCELVTPVLTYREDIESLQELIRELRKAGAFVDESSCGIHIHLDGADHTPRSIRNFINIIASKNDLLYKSLQIGSARTRWCKKMDTQLVETMNRKKPATFSQIENIWYAGFYQSRDTHYHNSRYHFLNLHSFFHGNHTVELRGFNSTLHAGKIRSYIVLALALNNQALTQKKASTKKNQTENEKFAEFGHNPRKFVSFNQSRLTALENKKTRNSIAKKFSIPLSEDTGIFDTSVDGASEKIVKLLCNKGMLDPFDNDPVEVDGARQWK